MRSEHQIRAAQLLVTRARTPTSRTSSLRGSARNLYHFPRRQRGAVLISADDMRAATPPAPICDVRRIRDRRNPSALRDPGIMTSRFRRQAQVCPHFDGPLFSRVLVSRYPLEAIASSRHRFTLGARHAKSRSRCKSRSPSRARELRLALRSGQGSAGTRASIAPSTTYR